jgi:hypothetical protein
MAEAATTSPAEESAPANDPPIWDGFKGELYCPLCDYNLRGLNEPRCPECGHRFTWLEVLEQRSAHPYLFEHQPKRNVWSFCKTFLRDWRPNTFWREVTPSHPVKPGRLVKYWLIANSVLLVLLVLPLIQTTIITARYNAMMRLRMPMVMPTAMSLRQTPATIAAWLNASWPTPWTEPFFAQVWSHFRWFGGTTGPIILILIWPWLTFLALLVFRISMRRARIKTEHVIRCAVYSCDFGVTVVGVLLAWTLFTQGEGLQPLMLAIILCPLIALYRLTIAYKRYMRLDHPFFTALASQTIVTLAVIDFALNS